MASMMNFNAHIAVLIGSAALFLGSANAHGYITKPKVTFVSQSNDNTQFIGTIDASASGFPGPFNTSPEQNAAAFDKAFKASKYSSIREFVTELVQITVEGANTECGSTDPNEEPQPLPPYLEWSHSPTEGFTSSHCGPCCAYCDNTLVFEDDNCPAHFTTAPAKMPYNKAGCSGASRLTFYWLALHTPKWQVYANCAALEGGSGAYSPSQSNSTSTGSTKHSKTPTDTTDQSNTPTDSKDQSETLTDSKDQSETPTDSKDQSETPTDSKDQPEIPTDSKDQSETLTDSKDQSETPTDSKDQSETPTDTTEQSKTPENSDAHEAPKNAKCSRRRTRG